MNKQTNELTNKQKKDLENQLTELTYVKEIPEGENEYPFYINECGIEVNGVILPILLKCVYILFIIFSIMTLVNTSDHELREMCPETNLWIYLLIFLIINIINIINYIKNNNNSSNEESKNNFLIKIIILGIICWGSYELWGVECVNEIKSNSIYTMSEISVIVGWVAIAIGTIVSCIGLCMLNR
jgi:hypothetical protein